LENPDKTGAEGARRKPNLSGKRTKLFYIAFVFLYSLKIAFWGDFFVSGRKFTHGAPTPLSDRKDIHHAGISFEHRCHAEHVYFELRVGHSLDRRGHLLHRSHPLRSGALLR
jgi:hypothetical protein